MSLQTCIAKENEGILLWYAESCHLFGYSFLTGLSNGCPLERLMSSDCLILVFFRLAYYEVLLTVYVVA